jgi:hypothetical protein
MRDEQQTAAAGIIAFRCSAELRERVQQAAAPEGLKSSDIARRAVLRDLGGWRKPTPAGLTSAHDAPRSQRLNDCRDHSLSVEAKNRCRISNNPFKKPKSSA